MSRRAAFDVAALDYRFSPAHDARPSVGKSERYLAAERPTPKGHTVTAHLGDVEVGKIEWHPNSGMVNMVKTHRDYRGKGIASALWGAAHVHAARHGVIPPRHSDVKLPDGQRWANSMTANSGPKPMGRRRLSREAGAGQEGMF